MARLAIRATGDRSKRENTTTGDSTVLVRVFDGNMYTHTIRIATVGDSVAVSVSQHIASAHTTVHGPCDGKHKTIQHIAQCVGCCELMGI